MNKQISVFSAVCIKDNKVLMVLRDEEENPDAHLKWEFPGGKCDFGETPQESLERECREEAGIAVKATTLLPYVQTAYWEYDWGKQQTLCFLFLCEYIKDYPNKVKDHHVREIAWIELNKAKTIPSLPGTKEVLALVEKIKAV